MNTIHKKVTEEEIKPVQTKSDHVSLTHCVVCGPGDFLYAWKPAQFGDFTALTHQHYFIIMWKFESQMSEKEIYQTVLASRH